MATAVADQPSNKEKNKQRLEELRRKKAAKADAVAANPGDGTKPTRTKKEKTVRPCACGCSGQTTAFFVPGHDARFKGWLLKIERGEKEVSSLPPAIQSAYKWKKKGKGMIPTTNYKGEPHNGYLTEEETKE